MDRTVYLRTTNTGNINCYNVSNSHNNITNISNIANVNNVIADENLEIMEWLSPLDARRKHRDVRTDRLDGVGNWLLGTNEFRKWRSRGGGVDKAVLFCYGNPGVGKTYLSSLVIDSLCDEPRDEDTAIAMFYCDFRDQQLQTTTSILGAILRQLVAEGKVPEHVKTAKREVGGRGLRLPDMVQMLKKTVAILPRVFICIDALDECLPNHLLELLGSLRDIVRESSRTRIFVTGRPQVEAGIKRYFATMVTVPISPKAQDIKRYSEKKLEMDTEPDAMSPDLRADILRIIPERIPEILPLVSLSIDAIMGEATIFERRKKLHEMTRGTHLGDAYAATLERMKAQKGGRPRLGMGTLMWVSSSERPLRAGELCHALGVKIASADLEPENIPTIRTLLGCCLGLITVDAFSDTVRLVHLTLQEYLCDNPSLFQSPHSMIAEVCLTYLNFQCVRKLSPTLSSAPPTLPLVGYASCYWEKHISREKTESVSPLTLQLLTGFEQHISSQLLLQHHFKDRWWDRSFDKGHGPNGFTGLHGAAFLGITETVVALLAVKEWDTNATDAMGRTALTWAAMEGHEDVVTILLQPKDVNPNVADTKYGRTPLWWAVERGHAATMNLLLEREDINPNISDDERGQTPLSLAVGRKDEGAVKLLLEGGNTDPNTADARSGRTPLSWAAERGHEGLVMLLLERSDINPNTADTGSGRTPLSWAAGRGHEAIVKLLLEREDINPNIADTGSGRTPLSWAAWRGLGDVVKLLLEREDINPNTADTEFGRTPLSWAAGAGNEGIVKLLLERGDINPNTTDTEHGQTPLSWAVEGGHEGVVRLLLGGRDINPDTADNLGRTPLWWAANGGREEVVRLLLERGDINLDTADTQYGRTPLLWSAKEGREGVVRLLLERKDVNPGTSDTQYGGTPLWWAAKDGNEGVVRLLLERTDINPNTADTRSGRTPLLWAARGGHDGVVKLLLAREDLNLDMPGPSGETALRSAASLGHTRIVALLSEFISPPPVLVPAHSGFIQNVLHFLCLSYAKFSAYFGNWQINIDRAPEDPSPEPSYLLQNSSELILSASLSPPKPVPHNTQPLLAIPLPAFLIIFSLIFLLLFLAIINLSSPSISFLSFYR